jgi:UDP-N-acetylglucosamine 2-epimerase (non-hydrolysing)
MIILHVVGARPNFMKAAPVLRALQAYPTVRQVLVHTGQHYDANMSGTFFDQLGMPPPDHNLEVGSGSHAKQTAEIMIRFEQVLVAEKPEIVLVYGDVNSTVAATLVASKLGIRVAHVEAGLRSFDRTMPEEINRLLTDQISDLLFTPSADGDANLLREGVPPEKIRLVGNVMIDTLVRLLPQARKPALPNLPERFALVTLHRPSNVDDPVLLEALVRSLARVGRTLPVLFPVHPRTRQKIAQFGLQEAASGLILAEPLGYLEFLWLQQHAAVVVTDSGGIQEETTYLQVPCLTMRANTERPVTVDMGTNVLVGADPLRMEREIEKVLGGLLRKGTIPPLWDGHAGERIAAVLAGSHG